MKYVWIDCLLEEKEEEQRFDSFFIQEKPVSVSTYPLRFIEGGRGEIVISE